MLRVPEVKGLASVPGESVDERHLQRFYLALRLPSIDALT